MKKQDDKEIEIGDQGDKCKSEASRTVNKKLDVGALNLSSTILTNILNNEENTPAEEELKPRTNLLTKAKLDKKMHVRETVELDTEAIRISEIILTNVTEDTPPENKNSDLDLVNNSKSTFKKTVAKQEKSGRGPVKPLKTTATTASTTASTTAPTTAPTKAPTTALTAAPTAVPAGKNMKTVAPTTAPTTAPITAPTTAPTEALTTAMTTAPSLTPNTAPITAPTALPAGKNIKAPITAPAKTPTAAPITAPTALPAGKYMAAGTRAVAVEQERTSECEGKAGQKSVIVGDVSQARQCNVIHRPLSPPTSDKVRLDNINKKVSRILPTVKAEPEGKFISDEIYRDSSSRQLVVGKDKSDLDREIEALEKKHATKLDRINESHKEKKIDLSNTDVNANRPSVLGPSRFEVTSYAPYKLTSSDAPRRVENSDARSHQVSRVTTVSSPSRDLKAPQPTRVTNVTSPSIDLKSQQATRVTSVTSPTNFTPEQRRKRFDNNFNAVPEPFKSKSKSNVADSLHNVPSFGSSKFGDSKSVTKPSYYAAPESHQASYLSPSYSSLSSLPSPATYTGPYSATLPPPVSPPAPSSSLQSSTLTKGSSSRAKSEGTGLSGSSQYKDFYHQIQVSKDKYKSDVEKAMSFDRTTMKPPIIREKLPRPDATPMLCRRQERRQEREATVISAIVTDRARRGKSDDYMRSSFRF